MINYRKIYEQYYGPISKDESGRTYEVHHIDGNHKNNDPTNLIAVTIQEHYNIHYDQGDWGACQAILIRMNQTPEEISEICRKLAKKQISNGTHHFFGESNPNKNMPKIVCPHCGKIGGRNQMKRWHFDNCTVKRGVESTGVKHKSHKKHGPRTREHTINQKISQTGKKKPPRSIIHRNNISLSKKGKPSSLKNKPREKVTCPSCHRVGGDVQMKRWHFDNCRFKE